MNDILVIKLKVMLKEKDKENLYKHFIECKEKGVILIPPYCEALMIPETCEMRFEDIKGNEVKGEKR